MESRERQTTCVWRVPNCGCRSRSRMLVQRRRRASGLSIINLVYFLSLSSFLLSHSFTRCTMPIPAKRVFTPAFSTIRDSSPATPCPTASYISRLGYARSLLLPTLMFHTYPRRLFPVVPRLPHAKKKEETTKLVSTANIKLISRPW